MSSALEDLVASMTIAELAQRSGRSISEIALYALGNAAGPRASASVSASNGAPKKRGRPPGSGSGAVVAVASVRKASDRADFEDRVLVAVKNLGGSAQSVDIEKVLGGTPLQRRSALKRLVKKRKLTRTGNARSTRYTLR